MCPIPKWTCRSLGHCRAEVKVTPWSFSYSDRQFTMCNAVQHAGVKCAPSLWESVWRDVIWPDWLSLTLRGKGQQRGGNEKSATETDTSSSWADHTTHAHKCMHAHILCTHEYTQAHMLLAYWNVQSLRAPLACTSKCVGMRISYSYEWGNIFIMMPFI